MSTFKGTIITWKADRGFGFIKPEDGGKEVFVHIKGLNHRQYQPNIGDKIEYKLTTDRTGRIRAYDGLVDGVEPYQRDETDADDMQDGSGGGLPMPMLIGGAIVAVIVAYFIYNAM
jgi:cold shock CspA family protein